MIFSFHKLLFTRRIQEVIPQNLDVMEAENWYSFHFDWGQSQNNNYLRSFLFRDDYSPRDYKLNTSCLTSRGDAGVICACPRVIAQYLIKHNISSHTLNYNRQYHYPHYCHITSTGTHSLHPVTQKPGQVGVWLGLRRRRKSWISSMKLTIHFQCDISRDITAYLIQPAIPEVANGGKTQVVRFKSEWKLSCALCKDENKLLDIELMCWLR